MQPCAIPRCGRRSCWVRRLLLLVRRLGLALLGVDVRRLPARLALALQRGVANYDEAHGKGFICWRFINEFRGQAPTKRDGGT